MLNPNDYQQLFQIELKYLISDIFAQHYKTLNCLLICDNGLWTSYLPKKIVEKTLKDGEKLFGSEKLFSQFEGDFKVFVLEFKATLEKILSEDLTEESVNRFLYTVAANFWKFYSKTEFFYTDKAVLAKPSGILLKNLKALEQIKNDGRLIMNELVFEDKNYLSRFLSKISERFSIPLSDLRSYSIKEITNLFTGKKVQLESLKRRKEFFLMQGDGEKIIYKEGKKLKEEFINFLINEKKELKGIIANKGIAKGKVKIFPPSYYSDFSILTKLFGEMNDGDILVAETTSPELMPACKKAGAILTNQGGLLSHAAIVSRELNIPCIVGLGNVVQVLKNGDIVEVDADRGIVRKI